MMMNDVGMSPRQQSKGATCADDIDRLPQAIEHQHRLVKSYLHGPKL